MPRTTALGLGLVLLLAGCGADSTVEVVTAEASPSPAAIDCGAHEIAQGERLDSATAVCLLEAVAADEPANLEITFPTIEGDPITQVYRHLGQGRVQVVTDSSKDRFGSGEIQTEICTGLVRSSFAFTFADCT